LLPDECDELDLLAFRYVAGEMAPHEACAFEARLVDDQAAREAVSRAVGLTQRLVEAGPSAPQAVPMPDIGAPSAKLIRRGSLLTAVRPLGWMVAGAAAALLIVSLLGWRATPTNHAPRRVTPQEGSRSPPAADALVWARLQSSDAWTTAELERWLAEPEFLIAEDAGERLPSPELPAWVFAARAQPEK
jgi:hypothetical protein